MSRHNASRRRSYGRRQHELRERRPIETGRETFQADDTPWLEEAPARALRDLLSPRVRWAEAG